MRVLIVGCGYVGLPLGAELARRGHKVFGLRRGVTSSGALADCGITPITADVTQREQVFGIPGPFDWVINTVSSTKGGVDEYRAVYLEGTRNLIAWLAGQPPLKFVGVSSTSVYGQTDGSWVTEDSVTAPTSETSKVLIQTEELLRTAARESNFPAAILRVAGIYGPQRGHLFQQFLRGEARLPREERVMNMVHRDDVVAAIIGILERGEPGSVYNLADDEPVTQREFFQWLSDQLGKPLPSVSNSMENAIRRRGLTNKRVSNQKLKLALGGELKYPTFRQGYTAEIDRLRATESWPAQGGQP